MQNSDSMMASKAPASNGLPTLLTLAIGKAAPHTTVLVDFDETLFLRNSTEAYLNCLFPQCLGVLLSKSLNWLQPWNHLPDGIRGEQSRDWLRVVIATLLFPWTPLIWRVSVKKLASSYRNVELMEILNRNLTLQVIIATDGFDFIVRPLANFLGFTNQQILACRFWRGGIDRHTGKTKRIVYTLGEETVAKAIAITDSTHDAPLLSVVGTPFLIRWSQAQYVPALANVYFPLFYLEKIKRPGKQYFFKTVLYDDLLVLLLALNWYSVNPFAHGMSIVFLLLSFWCINEVGYYENDVVAEKYEKDPVLSDNYYQYKSSRHRMSVWLPWAYALALAIPGVIIFQLSDGAPSQILWESSSLLEILSHLGLWMTVLLALRSCYWIYNHLNKQTRVWIYPILQGFKYFSYLVITATNVIGAALFTAQVMARSLPYFIYRHHHTHWTDSLPWEVIRTLVFISILFTVAIGNHDFSAFVSLQTLIIFTWCGFRSRRYVGKMIDQAQFIWKSS
jgi:hypothetical protein